MLLSIPQCTGQPRPSRKVPAQTPTWAEAEKPCLERSPQPVSTDLSVWPLMYCLQQQTRTSLAAQMTSVWLILVPKRWHRRSVNPE